MRVETNSTNGNFTANTSAPTTHTNIAPRNTKMDAGSETNSTSALGSIFYTSFSVLMVVGPVVGYLFQWAKMHNSRSCDGYSPFVSLILIACNTLRIVYYFGETFATMLLWQSMVMLITQFGLLLTVIKIRFAQRIVREASAANSSGVFSHPQGAHVPSPFTRFMHRVNPLLFTPAELVLKYIIAFVLVMVISLVMFRVAPGTASYMGYLSLGIEATLVMPQILLNLQRKSTEGLSYLLVFTWCAGDVVKMIFFVVEQQPKPFVVCGAVQLLCDVVVLLQLWGYRNPLSRKGYGVNISTVEDGGDANEEASHIVSPPDSRGASGGAPAFKEKSEWL